MLDAGRIVEDGNHEELLTKQGIYARLFAAQARWYGEEAPLDNGRNM